MLMTVLLVSIISVGCSDDLDTGIGSGGDAGYITIKLRNSKVATRAADNTNNEDLIKSAVICLYPNGAEAAVTPSFVEYVQDIDKNQQAEVIIKLSKGLANTLFGNGDGTCTAYVIANLPAEEARKIDVNTPLESLGKIVVNPDFASMKTQESFVMDGTSTVTRTGANTSEDKATGSVELRRAASKISFSIKISNEYIDDSNAKWIPDPDHVSVLITNGVTRSQVESSSYAVTNDDYYRTTTSGDENHRQRTFSKVEGADYPYQLTSPFYTFPNEWNPAEVETPMTYMTLTVPWRKEGEERYRTCFYMVPIVKENSLGRNINYVVKLNVDVLGSFTPDIPMPLNDLSYYAVEWGSVDMDVDLNESRYLVVDRNNYELNNDSFISIPVYTSHETIITDIKCTYYRYNTSSQGMEVPIEVTKEQYNNTVSKGYGKIYDAEVTESYTSTGDVNHALELTHDLKVWDPYNASDERVTLELINKYSSEDIWGNTTWTYLYPDNIDGNIKSIDYYRKTDVDAFSKYKFEITIQHKDKSESNDPNEKNTFKEVITVIQYPSVYIDVYGGYRWTGSDVSGSNGNTFINGSSNSSSNGWCYVYGIQTNNNANPNNTIITITHLDNTQNYIIGDPREATPTDLTGTQLKVGNMRPNYISFNTNGNQAPERAWVEAPGIENLNENRKLKNYYSTRGAGYERYIAPKLRLASSFGICSSGNDMNQNKLRCAGYQELSRPAGRWRMPTVAEIEFIMKLSNEKKIPTTFNEGSDYMSAQGVVNSDYHDENGNFTIRTNVTQAAVRCVYDEWYWGNDTITPISGTSGTRNERYQFTWGDRPR